MTNNIVNSKLFLNKFSNREKIYKFKDSNFFFFVQNNLRTSIQNFQVYKNNANNQQTMSRVHNHDNFHHTFISRTYNRVAKQQSLNKFQAIKINPYNTQDGFPPKLPQGNHLAWINTTKPNVLT